MIRPDDSILIGLSGGKDSLLLALALAILKKRSPVRFSLRACLIDQSNGAMEPERLAEYMAALGIPLTIVKHPTYQIMKEREERSPCSLCANMRRGILANQAKELACGVIALGHHKDDAAETVLAGAGMLKNTIGVFGMLAILAACAYPFLQLGVQYLLYKLTAYLASVVGAPGLCKLIDGLGGAFGLILGMTGGCALLLLISVLASVGAVMP